MFCLLAGNMPTTSDSKQNMDLNTEPLRGRGKTINLSKPSSQEIQVSICAIVIILDKKVTDESEWLNYHPSGIGQEVLCTTKLVTTNRFCIWQMLAFRGQQKYHLNWFVVVTVLICDMRHKCVKYIVILNLLYIFTFYRSFMNVEYDFTRK